MDGVNDKADAQKKGESAWMLLESSAIVEKLGECVEHAADGSIQTA